MSAKRVPCVLTIAGSDSGGGAGVQADARTIESCGCHALSAITAITAQNTMGVRRWQPVSPALLRAQIDAVLDDFDVRAIKTGLLSDATLPVVARVAARRGRIPLVVDPVIASSSGARFLSRRGVELLKRTVLGRATLVTPNWPEAEALGGLAIRNEAEAKAAALHLARALGTEVLLKGGHSKSDQCVDFLATPDGKLRRFSSWRVKTRNTHGTGCVLSAAIAAGLARGQTLQSAVRSGRTLLLDGLRRGRGSRFGSGSGPALASA
jgi:hydroxymethylpyrimidine/phosphomethylpyrimidine kinase